MSDVQDGVLTEMQRRAVALLRRGPQTCTTLGSGVQDRAWHLPQTYARQGGTILKALERRGIVQRRFDGYHWWWTLTDAYRREHAGGAPSERGAEG